MKLLLILGVATAAYGQQFEVASVKVAPPPKPGQGIMRMCGTTDPIMFDCTNMTLRALLQRAYGVKAYQIEGPSWMDSDGFDVRAKIPDGVPKEQVPVLLQALLAERFGLKLHKETRPLPVYELTVNKGGVKWKELSEEELAKEPPAGRGPMMGTMPAPPPPPPAGGGGSGGPVIGFSVAGPGGGRAGLRMTTSSTGAAAISGRGTMTQLIAMFARAVDRPVVDATGLKGTYEMQLSYLASENSPMLNDMRAMMGASGVTAGSNTIQDSSAPIATVFQALQGAGLKLDKKNSPTEILVVDSANRVPAEN